MGRPKDPPTQLSLRIAWKLHMRKRGLACTTADDVPLGTHAGQATLQHAHAGPTGSTRGLPGMQAARTKARCGHHMGAQPARCA